MKVFDWQRVVFPWRHDDRKGAQAPRCDATSTSPFTTFVKSEMCKLNDTSTKKHNEHGHRERNRAAG